MRLSTRTQSQQIDQIAQKEFGLSPEVLMEAAGSAVAEEIHSALKNKKTRILILIGAGNNGADGLATARILKRKGFTNLVCAILREKSTPAKIWNFQLEKAQNSGVEILRLSSDRLKMEIANCEVIVEAILGTGFYASLDQELLELVQFLNSKNRFVVAVDSPLGLDMDTGLEKPLALRAKLTVTFGLAKPGFFISRGPRCVGLLKIHHIGFPLQLLRREAKTHFAWGGRACAQLLPTRDELSHKSNHGTVQLIAGSSEYPGAGLLAANGAGRAGAGYVYFYGDSGIYQNLQMIPEVIFRDKKTLDLKTLDKESCVIIGPGLGVNEETEKLLRELIKRKFERVVVDADALTVIAQKKIWPLPTTWIVTPHAGELSGLLQRAPKVLNADRFGSAQEAAVLLGCVVLFKGFRTIVASANLKMSGVVLAGNSGLAKAGSGDVLSGFIAAFYAQGLEPSRAAVLGAYVHGRLANEWCKEGKDIISLLPSDLTALVPNLIRKIREQKQK